LIFRAAVTGTIAATRAVWSIVRLRRPQPSLLALLASGYSPVYPCHVTARDMRSRPIGTGPFKFVVFKPNSIKVASSYATTGAWPGWISVLD
jgi:MarR-like DNA-binding transcriptional regulator SgrR of sgrS sRNA